VHTPRRNRCAERDAGVMTDTAGTGRRTAANARCR